MFSSLPTLCSHIHVDATPFNTLYTLHYAFKEGVGRNYCIALVCIAHKTYTQCNLIISTFLALHLHAFIVAVIVFTTARSLLQLDSCTKLWKGNLNQNKMKTFSWKFDHDIIFRKQHSGVTQPGIILKHSQRNVNIQDW